MNMFEKASREKLRFPSAKGGLTVEQLWDLKLTKANDVDLDTVAKAVAAELRGVTEESFVATKTNPQKAIFELKLEIVKYIIGVKIQEELDAKTAAGKAARRKVLLEALDKKQGEAVLSMDEAAIRKELEGL